MFASDRLIKRAPVICVDFAEKGSFHVACRVRRNKVDRNKVDLGQDVR